MTEQEGPTISEAIKQVGDALAEPSGESKRPAEEIAPPSTEDFQEALAKAQAAVKGAGKKDEAKKDEKEKKAPEDRTKEGQIEDAFKGFAEGIAVGRKEKIEEYKARIAAAEKGEPLEEGDVQYLEGLRRDLKKFEAEPDEEKDEKPPEPAKIEEAVAEPSKRELTPEQEKALEFNLKHKRRLEKKFAQEAARAENERRGWAHSLPKEGQQSYLNECLRAVGFTDEQIETMSSTTERYAAACKHLLGKTDEELEAVGLSKENIPAPEETVNPELLTQEWQDEQWLLDKIARENAKDAPDWGGKPNALMRFLEAKGMKQNQIAKMSNAKCYDEATRILNEENPDLNLERKKAVRGETKREKELRERLETLEKRGEERDEKIAQLEERLTAFQEENERLKKDVVLLLKALEGGELSDEEKTRLAELKGEKKEEKKEKEKEGKVEIEEADAETAKKTEEEEKKGFCQKACDFFKDWWKGVSPQGRNKWCWSFGAAIGALEQLGLKPLLTPILGPASGLAVSAVNTLAIQGVNYRLQKGITEAKASGDAERLTRLEKRYSRCADVMAGIAAGQLGGLIGGAVYDKFITPKLPVPAMAAVPKPPVEGVVPVPAPEAAIPPVTALPVEKAMEYIVKSGDTVSEIIAKKGFDPYGEKLTEVVINNAELFSSKGPEYAAAVVKVQANSDWIARGGGNEVWQTLMKAARLINPGDLLKI